MRVGFKILLLTLPITLGFHIQCIFCTHSLAHTLIRFPHAFVAVVVVSYTCISFEFLYYLYYVLGCVWRWPMCMKVLRFALSLFHSNVFVMFLFSSLKMLRTLLLLLLLLTNNAQQTASSSVFICAPHRTTHIHFLNDCISFRPLVCFLSLSLDFISSFF